MSSRCVSAQVKVSSYKQLSISLPYSIIPSAVTSTLSHPEGSVRTVHLRVRLPVDQRYSAASIDTVVDPDCGSKQWLVAVALRDGGADDPYLLHQGALGGASGGPERGDDGDEFLTGTGQGNEKVEDEEDLPEDRFHIKLPAGVDKYTGVRLDEKHPDAVQRQRGPREQGGGRSVDSFTVEGGGGGEEELPEDRFHKRDAASSCIIQQREQAVKDKWEKHAK